MAWTTPRTWVTGELITAGMLNTDLRDNLKALGDPWTSYTSSWTAVTTNPVIGNGTIEAAHMTAGKLVAFRIKVTMGSTTTYGSGGYRLSLPAGAATGMEFSTLACSAFDTSASANFPCAAQFLSGSPTLLGMRAFPGTAGNAYSQMAAATPFTFATGDVIAVTGVYEAA